MKFMVLMKATPGTEAGVMPSTELLTAMGSFNEELVNAGIMKGGDGLHPSSKAARVYFDGDQVSVTDGPFAETKEQLGGYYLIEAKDLNDAIQIGAKIPAARSGSIEIRPIMVYV